MRESFAAGVEGGIWERGISRESGVGDAGLRRASLPPQSKTLARCSSCAVGRIVL